MHIMCNDFTIFIGVDDIKILLENDLVYSI